MRYSAGGILQPHGPALQRRRSSEKARDVILTTAPRLTLPHNSAFKLHAEPGAKYLVETDPRFANYRNFLSSDYFEKQLQLDPERNLKRYGDGFMEQQLVNDQILALTGHRFIGNYTDNTDLQGGAITSTQAAIDAGKNTLATGSLTASDLQNHSDYKAQSLSIAVGASGGSAGAYQASGHDTSTTKAWPACRCPNVRAGCQGPWGRASSALARGDKQQPKKHLQGDPAALHEEAGGAG